MFLDFMLMSSREEPPNARHHPPRIQLNQHSSSRMKTALFAVGCMPLFGIAVA